MALSVVSLDGEYGSDPGHDRERREEQALEGKRVVDVGGHDGAGHRHTLAVHRDGGTLCRAWLGPLGSGR
jgi:hypothetical protein